MKRWLIALAVAVGLVFAASFIFFPNSVTSANVVNLPCNFNTLNRFILTQSQWKKWWPGTITEDSTAHSEVFNYNGYNFYIREFRYNAISIEMKRQELEIKGNIYFLPLKGDTIRAEWKYNLTSDNNPVSRIHLKMETERINRNMQQILQSMRTFVSNSDNIYGMKIRETWVKDTLVVMTEFSTPEVPSTKMIYEKIGGIKKYIAYHRGLQTDPPMVNMTRKSDGYLTKVGIPVNRDIPTNKTYSLKYLVPGRILEGEVTGGRARADEALFQLGEYVRDYHYSSPAIPFQSLVTDRMAEPDSTKWITRVYYPVF